MISSVGRSQARARLRGPRTKLTRSCADKDLWSPFPVRRFAEPVGERFRSWLELIDFRHYLRYNTHQSTITLLLSTQLTGAYVMTLPGFWSGLSLPLTAVGCG